VIALSDLTAASAVVCSFLLCRDTGTRRCGAGATCGGSENRTNATAVCKASVCNSRAACTLCDARIITGLIKEMNADGFNGDTMANVPYDFYHQSRLINHSIAIEPEGGGGGVIDGVSTGNWDTMGWGYWCGDSQSFYASGASILTLPLFVFFPPPGSTLTSPTWTRGSGWTRAA
jgi:hypothetical protein